MIVAITKQFSFEAAHFLPDYDGKCNSLHGHSYKLRVTVARVDKAVTVGGQEDGMVIDFGVLKKIVNEKIISKLDHAYLNEIFPFRPTAELMARWMFQELDIELAKRHVRVLSITLWETEDSFVEVIG
jgi:6-pyruvoyltetrahydropterin/6-carboxytetrahydropterin synthase